MQSSTGIVNAWTIFTRHMKMVNRHGPNRICANVDMAERVLCESMLGTREVMWGCSRFFKMSNFVSELRLALSELDIHPVIFPVAHRNVGARCE